MKTFWLLVCLMVVGGATYLAWSAMSASRQRAVEAEQSALRALAAAQAADERALAQPAPAPPAAPDVAKPVAPKPEPTTPATSTPAPEVPKPEAAKSEVPKPEGTKPESPKPEVKKTEPAPAASEQKPATSGTVGASEGKFGILPSKMEPQEDGSVLVDGVYRITGDGSVEKPYEIAWEMLLAAEKTYNPTEKLTKIPQAVAMLDGKYVRITGYVAFPLYVQEPRELLSMLNQWDGCCIGVPPTPYDAIEVTLKKTVEGDDRMATFGAVEGRFGVKPYVVGDWLVGLYVMDEGTLIAKRFNGSGT